MKLLLPRHLWHSLRFSFLISSTVQRAATASPARALAMSSMWWGAAARTCRITTWNELLCSRWRFYLVSCIGISAFFFTESSNNDLPRIGISISLSFVEEKELFFQMISNVREVNNIPGHLSCCIDSFVPVKSKWMRIQNVLQRSCNIYQNASETLKPESSKLRIKGKK